MHLVSGCNKGHSCTKIIVKKCKCIYFLYKYIAQPNHEQVANPLLATCSRFTHTFIPSGNLESPISLLSGRTCKLLTHPTHTHTHTHTHTTRSTTTHPSLSRASQPWINWSLERPWERAGYLMQHILYFSQNKDILHLSLDYKCHWTIIVLRIAWEGILFTPRQDDYD